MAARDKIKELLRIGACTDAKHDFKDLKGEFINVLLRGLPAGDDPKFSSLKEEDLLINLNKIFRGDETTPIKNLIEEIKKNNNNLGIDFNGYMEKNTYTISMLKKGTNLNVQNMIDNASLSTRDFSSFFGTNTINFLIDAASVGIMDLISTLKGEPININLIINRESLNDPAKKISEFDNKRTNKSAVKAQVLYDRNPYSVDYPHISNRLSYENYLYSAFDYELEPILIEQAGPKGAIKSTLKTVYIRKGKDLIDTVNNPKESNEIGIAWEKIKSQYKDYPLKASSRFQGKRSGDWLQTLSCMDISREYGNPLTGKINPLHEKIILVTHDRVLLWYSLIMGINVLYTTKDASRGDDAHSSKYLIYFKNTNEREYIVERIKGHRLNENGKVELEVKWEGYKESENTWEPLTQIANVDVVKKYMEENNLNIPSPVKKAAASKPPSKASIVKKYALKIFSGNLQSGGQKTPPRSTRKRRISNNNNNNNNNNITNKNVKITKDNKKFLIYNYLKEFESWIKDIDFESNPDSTYYETHASALNGYFEQCKTFDDYLYVIYTYMPERSFLARQIALHSFDIDSANEDFFERSFLATLHLNDTVHPIHGKDTILDWIATQIKILPSIEKSNNNKRAIKRANKTTQKRRLTASNTNNSMNNTNLRAINTSLMV